MALRFTVLFLGDVVGQSGCRAVALSARQLAREHNADLVIVNGENAADGFGLTPEIVAQFLQAGVDVITTGNHIWQRREVLDLLESEQRLLRPHNYPRGVPGHGSCIVDVRGTKVAVVNAQGRVRLSDVQCPFATTKDLLKKLRQETKIVIVDFHAEDTDEKEALGLYLDGLASAIVGTHTHVQTADERLLPKGTAYISDLGMVGPGDSVIGFKIEVAIQRSLTQMPLKMEVSDNPAVVNGVVLVIDADTGKALSIQRVRTVSLV